MSSTKTDAALWEAIRQDDAHSFSVLFDRYWSTLFTTAFAYCKDREACSEIVHDIFLNLWQKRGQLQISSFPHYLKAATRYHTYRHMQSAKVIPLLYSEDLHAVRVESTHHSGEEEMRYTELESQLENSLENLPKRCREIFCLSRKEDLTNDEIADRLGISKRTVENQLTHALQHLRLVLKELVTCFILFALSQNS
ncbi:RNA polymerase sigma factor [Botryobacter ruber]|uniref:RNA polymerase sigma factor n=1 Tax=Botryobacter ruber TaxID=2171629 RepID=UPI000E09F583|nr:RNA polymerase sigma-70 factor [Botryobacter ruber]